MLLVIMLLLFTTRGKIRRRIVTTLCIVEDYALLVQPAFVVSVGVIEGLNIPCYGWQSLLMSIDGWKSSRRECLKCYAVLVPCVRVVRLDEARILQSGTNGSEDDARSIFWGIGKLNIFNKIIEKVQIQLCGHL